MQNLGLQITDEQKENLRTLAANTFTSPSSDKPIKVSFSKLIRSWIDEKWADYQKQIEEQISPTECV